MAEAAVAVSVLVVTYRQPELCEQCLHSVSRAISIVADECEIVVVDDGSPGHEATTRVRRSFPQARIVTNEKNMGFAPAVNQGLEVARGEWVLLINDDATVNRDVITELLAVARSSPDIGSVSALMLFAGEHRRGTINSAGIELDRLGTPYDRLLGRPASAAGASPVEVFGTCGGAAMYRRTMLDSVGGIDGTFTVYSEDADLAWRASMAAWRCMFVPTAIVHHHHSATTRHGSDFKYWHVGRNRIRMLAKNATTGHLLVNWPLMLAYDLAYVVHSGLADRTTAPLRGRVRGLREWRRYRAQVSDRRPVRMTPTQGLRKALHRRRTWLGARRDRESTRRSTVSDRR